MRSKGLKCGKDQGEEKLLEKGAGRGGVEPPGEWGWGRAGAGLIGAPRGWGLGWGRVGRSHQGERGRGGTGMGQSHWCSRAVAGQSLQWGLG